MTDAQRQVLDDEPTAFCSFNADRGTFKVYCYMSGPASPFEPFEPAPRTAVAMSSSWDTAWEAWKDAAESLQRRKVSA